MDNNMLEIKEPISDYMKYRGKCKEMVDEAVKNDPSLTAVRGHYICPFWGEQAHWWTVKIDGTIYDPTCKQFPSKGIGEYIPFDGTIACAECGTLVREEEADIDGRYAFCSLKCHMRFVGL
jgi:hypothetical protein